MVTQAATRTTTTTTEHVDPLDSAIQQTESKRQSTIGRAADYLGVPANKVFDVLRNQWPQSDGKPPLTDRELYTGLSLIARYELDPFSREIYVIRAKGGKIQTVVGIDGWIKILDRTPGYDGFDVDIHEDNGKVLWVDTTIHSTLRSHPVKYRAFMSEYAKQGGFVAGVMPIHMLRIFSLRHAARLFAPVGGGVMLEEEARLENRRSTSADFANIEKHLEQAMAANDQHPGDAEADDAARELSAQTPAPEQNRPDEPDAAEQAFIVAMERVESSRSAKDSAEAITYAEQHGVNEQGLKLLQAAADEAANAKRKRS